MFQRKSPFKIHYELDRGESLPSLYKEQFFRVEAVDIHVADYCTGVACALYRLDWTESNSEEK